MTDDEILAKRGEEFILNRDDLAAVSLFCQGKTGPLDFKHQLASTGWQPNDATALLHAVRIAKRAKFQRGGDAKPLSSGAE